MRLIGDLLLYSVGLPGFPVVHWCQCGAAEG
jgi:hypothetical protein